MTINKNRLSIINISIIIGIIAVGAFLRLTNLNAIPVFADESIYIRWSQVMKSESTLRFLPLSDGKQPLYMWTVMPFLKLISDPLIAARIVSGFCGIVTTIGVGLAAWLLFKNRRVAFLSAAIWSVLPYAVFFERLALADAMLAMFIIWTFNCMYIALKQIRLDFGMLAGFCLGFAWLTKSPAMIILLLLPCLLIVSINKSELIKQIGILLVCFVISYVMYNILRLGPEFHMIAIRNRDYIFPLSEIIHHPLNPLISNLKTTVILFGYLLTPVGLLLALLGILDRGKNHIPQRICLVIFLLLPIFIQSGIAKTFTARYLLYTIPFAVILISHAIEHIGQHTKKHFLVLVAAATVVIPSLWIDIQLLTKPENAPLPKIERSGYLEGWTAGYGIKEISQKINNLPPTENIVVGAEGFFGTPFSALQIYTNNHPNIRIVGVGIYVDTLNENLVQAKKDNTVFLVVNSSRFHIANPEKEGLLLLASFPKAIQADGSQEFTLFFQLKK